jgi:hypothetical protein
MPLFFFHVRSGDDDVSRDLEGQELADLAAAREEAMRANREILGERILHGGSLDSRKIEIADEKGAVLDTVGTTDVLFKDDQLRSFEDDVTKSAPVAHPVSAKRPAE